MFRKTINLIHAKHGHAIIEYVIILAILSIVATVTVANNGITTRAVISTTANAMEITDGNTVNNTVDSNTVSGGSGGSTTATPTPTPTTATTSYSVIYDANGGSNAPGQQTKYYGKVLTLSSQKPTRTGYTFTGWNTSRNGSGTTYHEGDSYSANAMATLYAQWTQAMYTISAKVEDNNNQITCSLYSFAYGDTINISAPTRTGYTFTGWSPALPETMPAYNISTTAQWEEISYKDISSLTIEPSTIADQAYTGSQITPAIDSVKDGSTTLTEGTDYTISYGTNTYAGTGTVTITGIGHYTGTKTLSFDIYFEYTLTGLNAGGKIINSKDLLASSTTTYSGVVAYTGFCSQTAYANWDDAQAFVAGLNVSKVDGKTTWRLLSSETDGRALSDAYFGSGNNGTIGGLTVLWSSASSGGYGYSWHCTDGGWKYFTKSGSASNGGFVVVCGPIPASFLTYGTISSKTYTGSAITPTVTVKSGTTTLTSGTDYTMSYKNNVNAGTATATFTFKGNYSGTHDITFKINPRSIASLTVEPSTIAAQAYTGSQITPAIDFVKYGSVTLVKDIDYTVSYGTNTDVGTGTVTITGIGNYTGTRTLPFAIYTQTGSFEYTLTGSNAGGKTINSKDLLASSTTTYSGGVAYTGFCSQTAYANWDDAQTFVAGLNASKVDGKTTWRLLSSEADACALNDAYFGSGNNGTIGGLAFLWSSASSGSSGINWNCGSGYWCYDSKSDSRSSVGFVVVCGS